MNRNVSVPLLEPIVFLDIMEVISPDHASTAHLQLGDDSGQDSATDGDIAGEGALLVDVSSLASLFPKKKIS